MRTYLRGDGHDIGGYRPGSSPKMPGAQQHRRSIRPLERVTGAVAERVP
jgi:hypothetical protein